MIVLREKKVSPVSVALAHNILCLMVLNSLEDNSLSFQGLAVQVVSLEVDDDLFLINSSRNCLAIGLSENANSKICKGVVLSN